MRADDGDVSKMAGSRPNSVTVRRTLIKRIIANDIQGGQRDWVLLNAAMLLYAAEGDLDCGKSLATARQALGPGRQRPNWPS